MRLVTSLIKRKARRDNFAPSTAVAFAVCAAIAEVWSASPASASAVSPPLRRLTEAQYRQSIADIFGSDIKFIGRFEPDMRVQGLLAEGTTRVSITPGGLEQYELIARGIAAQVVDQTRWGKLVGCAPDRRDADGARCAAAFFTRVGRQLYRRPLSATELSFAINSALASTKQLDNFPAGIAASLAGLLTSPAFLFRIDRVIADPKSPGQFTLDGWSKATQLSFFLWNTTPDDELLAAAARGELGTASGLQRQIDRLMTSTRFVTGTRAFFNDFLRLDELDTLAKDATIYPAFSAAVALNAREQTLRTIADLLVAQHGNYLDVFTTRRMAMNRVLGPLYNVPVTSKDWSFYEFPAHDPRAGLLTQLSFLALYSHPGRTSPTLRGKAIREVLMCEEVPSPPANVNFSVVQDTNNPNLRTTRERVQAHLNDEDCASCHKKTDPIGLGLEQFDGAGQFRLLENGSSIDTSGNLDALPFTGAAELGMTLSKSPAVAACLVQSAYRYATGRAIADTEQASVDNFQRQFIANDYRYADLMRMIAASPALYGINNTAPSHSPSLPRSNTVVQHNSVDAKEKF